MIDNTKSVFKKRVSLNLHAAIPATTSRRTHVAGSLHHVIINPHRSIFELQTGRQPCNMMTPTSPPSAPTPPPPIPRTPPQRDYDVHLGPIFQSTPIPHLHLHHHPPTNKELRDDLNIKSFARRRKILSTLRPPPAQTHLPEFGRILTYLSNVRTVHSWYATAVQLIVFSLAITRTPPAVTVSEVRFFAAGLVCVSIVMALYGSVRYWRVTRVLKGDEERYTPDTAAWAIVAMGGISVAALVLTIVGMQIAHG